MPKMETIPFMKFCKIPLMQHPLNNSPPEYKTRCAQHCCIGHNAPSHFEGECPGSKPLSYGDETMKTGF